MDWPRPTGKSLEPQGRVIQAAVGQTFLKPPSGSRARGWSRTEKSAGRAPPPSPGPKLEDEFQRNKEKFSRVGGGEGGETEWEFMGAWGAWVTCHERGRARWGCGLW